MSYESITFSIGFDIYIGNEIRGGSCVHEEIPILKSHVHK
jgi:hypothetical protein